VSAVLAQPGGLRSRFDKDPFLHTATFSGQHC